MSTYYPYFDNGKISGHIVYSADHSATLVIRMGSNRWLYDGCFTVCVQYTDQDTCPRFVVKQDMKTDTNGELHLALFATLVEHVYFAVQGNKCNTDTFAAHPISMTKQAHPLETTTDPSDSDLKNKKD